MPYEITTLIATLAASTTFVDVVLPADEDDVLDRVYTHRYPRGNWWEKIPFAVARQAEYERGAQKATAGEYRVSIFKAVDAAHWDAGGPTPDTIGLFVDQLNDICKELMDLADSHAAPYLAIRRAVAEEPIWPTRGEATTHGRFIRGDLRIQWGFG